MRQRGSGEECQHSNAVSTEWAGLARMACENCGHVSVSYSQEAVSIVSRHMSKALQDVSESAPAADDPESTMPKYECSTCGARAIFMIPGGFACEAHSWQAASEQDPSEADFWIPIRVARQLRQRRVS